jgi:hypothetical protein
MKKQQKKPDQKSLGTTIAERERAKANGYSDEKRHNLLERGMAMIYGGSGHAKSPVNRG